MTDVEFANITLIWPYTIGSSITGNAYSDPSENVLTTRDLAAPAFSVRLQIKPDGNEASAASTVVRSRFQHLLETAKYLLPFPDANFRQTRLQVAYKVTGRIFFPGNDLDTLNDSTFTNFEIALR